MIAVARRMFTLRTCDAPNGTVGGDDLFVAQAGAWGDCDGR